MKIETVFLATLLVMGTTLWVRILTQGVEPALLSTVIESCVKGVKAARSGIRRRLS